MEKKTHTQSLLHVGNRKIHFLPPHDPPTSVAEARCQISLQSSFCVVTTNVREMSCHPQNSELACSTPRSHFLLSLVRLFHCSSPSRPSLDWSVKIWLKQTQFRCCVATKKKPLQATNDVLFKTRIFPLCQCLKILIWFFCSIQSGFWKKNIINLEKWQCIEGRQNVEQLLMTLLPWTKRKRSRPRTFW